ncbi:hypothetical protein GCM10011492_11420 [Flexivirga endophytica]|uniref:Uncharacterized protein n=1 Tax=Flexivirga endophytica TaxID=1849103 RepID=A0A916SZH0_9MICO|nr:hypothetical protein GCM10011492_11420 [Flexivirga endophytica]GHB57197.1 hypothetical protein GCM10008112_27960 [Flexivirga endophytica]
MPGLSLSVPTHARAGGNVRHFAARELLLAGWRIASANGTVRRSVLALHRDCGSGSGVCDGGIEGEAMVQEADWGCETTAVVASHFGIEYPVTPPEAK